MNEKQRQGSAIGWLLGQAGEKKSLYALSVALAACSVVCSIVPYLLAAAMLRALITGGQGFGWYALRCGGMALAFAGQALFHAISTGCSHRATFHVLASIRKKGADKLARMPLGDVLSQPSGSLKNILVERIDSIETTLAHILPEFTSNLLAPVCLLAIIFATDWRMMFVSLITLPVGMLCYMGMMIGYEDNYKRTVRATKALNDTAVEYIHGIEVIKVFGKAKSSYERFVQAAREAADSYVIWMRKCNFYFTFAMNIMPATLVTVLPIGGLFVRDGSLAPADFAFIILLSVAIIPPLITCMSYSDDIGTLNTVVGEVRSVLDAPEMERPAALTETPRDNGIRLSGVRFGYGEKEVLHGVDMEIAEGSFVALVGPSGSGKTTIARLINALWDVQAGSITLGGVDIRKIPLADYSDRIAYVSQDNYLFDLSVRENIRMGKTSGAPATDAEVEQAARQSGCYDFIMSLEKGFDTVAGTAGGHLSGGERQRIAIARAMLKEAPIVILDEATAYTDPESEAQIQQSVARLVRGKTLIVIAHRLSTVKDADRLYVVEGGRIAEQGTHEALLAQGGLYARMWAAHISVKDSEEGGEQNA